MGYKLIIGHNSLDKRELWLHKLVVSTSDPWLAIWKNWKFAPSIHPWNHVTLWEFNYIYYFQADGIEKRGDSINDRGVKYIWERIWKVSNKNSIDADSTISIIHVLTRVFD